MKFNGRNKSFSIRINGYEFEKSEFKEDLDWLEIEVKVIDDDLKWMRSGAFIRTEELETILLLLKGELKNQNVEFLERDLSLSMIDNLIQVHLNYDLHPKGNNYDFIRDSEYVLIFDLNESQLNYAINEVEKWIELFPVKARLFE